MFTRNSRGLCKRYYDTDYYVIRENDEEKRGLSLLDDIKIIQWILKNIYDWRKQDFYEEYRKESFKIL